MRCRDEPRMSEFATNGGRPRFSVMVQDTLTTKGGTQIEKKRYQDGSHEEKKKATIIVEKTNRRSECNKSKGEGGQSRIGRGNR